MHIQLNDELSIIVFKHVVSVKDHLFSGSTSSSIDLICFMFRARRLDFCLLKSTSPIHLSPFLPLSVSFVWRYDSLNFTTRTFPFLSYVQNLLNANFDL